ncbi:MAG: hypothetical protein AABZ78_05535 [Chloroflexota bacterium]
MARKPQSKGACIYCGDEVAKGGMSKHLAACAKRKVIIEQAEKKKGASESLYHLRVQAAEGADFWLDLEMRGTSPLKDLDYYLRGIWLECCGHMSQFSFGGWGGDEIAMSRKIKDVMQPQDTLTHIYDFGTSSETLVKVVGIRQGKPATSHPIALMARNLMPEAKCIECEKLATWLCMECLIEEETPGFLCDEHAEGHPHDNYGEPMPLVNSPRVGMCGYDGPAEPPY